MYNIRSGNMIEDNRSWDFDWQEMLRLEELHCQERRQKMTEQERMEEDIFYAAGEGNLEEVQYLVSKGVKVNITDYSGHGIMTRAARSGHANVVKYALENSKNSEYSEDCLRDTFEYAISGGNLEVVKILLDRGIKFENGIRRAIYHEKEEIAQYLIENNDGSFCLESILECAIGHRWPSTVNLIAKKYPRIFAKSSELERYALASDNLDADVIITLRQYLLYLDVNNVPILDFHYKYYKTKSVLHALVFSYKSGDFYKLHREVKLFVAYGALLDECESIRNSLLESAPTEIEHRTSGCIVEYGEIAKQYSSRRVYAEIFDEAVKEGLEIWRWNQQVMREVVKWSGCVVMGYGGGDGVGTSRGMCSVVGIGKRAVDTLVQFAPAQFEEKLEMGTVRVLRAQAMLEMGHGIVFGDVHHGGYVKYVGTTSKGVTLHGWNATVTCDYHIDVRMTGWCEMHGQHSVGYDGGHSGDPTHGGKMPYGMQYSAHVTHMHMTRIVMADGDSYVDHKVTVMTDMWELASHVSVLLCTEMENGWVYNDKLCLQKNGAGQYALENEHAQGDGTMHVWGQGHDVNHGAVVVMGMHKLASHMYDKQGVVSYLRVWGGDAYDQKLHAQQQWYAETGEALPTLAVMTQSHHNAITVLDNQSSQTHAHDEAMQQDMLQVVPQLMHTSPQHHLQLHIPHDELQQDAGEPHIADFLHSISML